MANCTWKRVSFYDQKIADLQDKIKNETQTAVKNVYIATMNIYISRRNRIADPRGIQKRNEKKIERENYRNLSCCPNMLFILRHLPIYELDDAVEMAKSITENVCELMPLEILDIEQGKQTI